MIIKVCKLENKANEEIDKVLPVFLTARNYMSKTLIILYNRLLNANIAFYTSACEIID